MAMRDIDTLMTLSHACAELWRTRPWRVWHDEQPVEVVVTGHARRRYEASILGAAGEAFGVALYEKPGAVARVAAVVDAGRMDLARQEECIAVTLDSRPRFAAEALKAWTGVARVPVPIRLSGGQVAHASGLELAILAGAARAVAAIAPSRALEATVPIDSRDGEVIVCARAPVPAMTSSTPPPTSRRSRNSRLF